MKYNNFYFYLGHAYILATFFIEEITKVIAMLFLSLVFFTIGFVEEMSELNRKIKLIKLSQRIDYLKAQSKKAKGRKK